MSADAGGSRLRRNAIANIVGRVGSVALWIGVTPYALHQFGQERFAVWTLFFVLNGYVLALDLGAGAGVGRFVAVTVARGDRAETRRVMQRSLALGLGLGVLWAVLCLLCRGLFLRVFHVPPQWADEVRASLSIYAISLLMFALSQVLLGSLMGFQRFDLWNLYFLFGLAVHLGLVCASLALGHGLVGAALAAVAAHTVTSLLAGRSVLSELKRVPEGEGGARFTWRDLLGYGAMVQGANFFGLGQWQAGKVLLGAIGQLAWVTQFELGFRVTNALWSLSTLIQNAVIPAAAHAAEVGGMEETRRLYTWCCRWVILVGAYVLGLVGTTAPALFMMWLGGPHVETVSVARWLAVAFAFSTLAGPSTAIARGLGSPWYEAMNFAIALAINILCALVLIPKLGADGAGVSMAISFFIATIVLLAMFHRRIGVASGPWIVKVAAPRLLPAAIASIGLGLVADRWTMHSRIDAFVATAVLGTLYTLVFVAATWPTGDIKALSTQALQRLKELRGARAASARP